MWGAERSTSSEYFKNDNTFQSKENDLYRKFDLLNLMRIFNKKVNDYLFNYDIVASQSAAYCPFCPPSKSLQRFAKFVLK